MVTKKFVEDIVSDLKNSPNKAYEKNNIFIDSCREKKSKNKSNRKGHHPFGTFETSTGINPTDKTNPTGQNKRDKQPLSKERNEHDSRRKKSPKNRKRTTKSPLIIKL